MSVAQPTAFLRFSRSALLAGGLQAEPLLAQDQDASQNSSASSTAASSTDSSSSTAPAPAPVPLTSDELDAMVAQRTAELRGGKRHRVAAGKMNRRNEVVIFRDPGRKNAQVAREAHGHRRDRSGLDHQEQRPAV